MKSILKPLNVKVDLQANLDRIKSTPEFASFCNSRDVKSYNDLVEKFANKSGSSYMLLKYCAVTKFFIQLQAANIDPNMDLFDPEMDRKVDKVTTIMWAWLYDSDKELAEIVVRVLSDPYGNKDFADAPRVFVIQGLISTLAGEECRVTRAVVGSCLGAILDSDLAAKHDPLNPIICDGFRNLLLSGTRVSSLMSQTSPAPLPLAPNHQTFLPN
jgi:hypothetical protein